MQYRKSSTGLTGQPRAACSLSSGNIVNDNTAGTRKFVIEVYGSQVSDPIVGHGQFLCECQA